MPGLHDPLGLGLERFGELEQKRFVGCHVIEDGHEKTGRRGRRAHRFGAQAGHVEESR